MNMFNRKNDLNLKKDVLHLMNPGNFTFSTKDGQSLFGRAWVCTEISAKGIVHLIHDLGEHSGRYDHIAKKLTKAGYHLTSFDLRGHGLSAGPRGHAPGFDHLIDDIQRFSAEITKMLGNSLPKFYFGQGLGGNLVIHYGLQKQSGMDGAIITSPAFKAKRLPNLTKKGLFNLLNKAFPGRKFRRGFDPNALSRNAAVVKAYQTDVYNHRCVSARLGTDIFESGRSALLRAEEWSLPTLLMHGSDDQITSCTASQEFADKAGDNVDFICWEGFYHELHNDLGSEAVLKRITQWLNQPVS
jgi:acylglycerol lipase